jgi:hypothetical protein
VYALILSLSTVAAQPPCPNGQCPLPQGQPPICLTVPLEIPLQMPSRPASCETLIQKQGWYLGKLIREARERRVIRK